MHKPESVQENEKLEIFWDFQLQTDHQISAKKANLVLIIRKK